MAHHATAPEAPQLHAAAVAQRFEQVTAMIAAGNPRAARRATETLLAAADDPTAELLRTCLQALELARPVSMARLRWLWQHADDDQRVLVEAVVPREAAPASRPATGPVAGAAARAPREHATRQGAARGIRGAAETNAARSATRYFAEGAAPGGIDALTDAEPDARTSPEWVDDDLAAMAPVSGTLCVSCWIERPTAEQRRLDDDGLCADCRDAGRPGVPAPVEATRAGRLRARIAHIAEGAATREQALSLLRGEYHRAHGAAKGLIVAWVTEHLPA